MLTGEVVQMPIYQIDVQKNLGTEYWTNVYHVTMTSFDDAVDAVPLIVNGERGIHYTNITFDKARVSVYPVTGGVFTILPLAFAGELSGVADLALFNVARVEFQVPIGRPGIKMYRGALNEGDIEGVGKITSATQTRFEAWVTAVLGDV